MTVNKLQLPAKQNVVQLKINEIIDNLSGASITIDNTLSTTSTNPVQNKVITTELNKKIEGISSNDVIGALGYTPYNSTNPEGYTNNVGTVTSVNNVSPVNGNITLSIPSAVTESTVSGWGFTKNTGTITGITMNGTSKGTSGVVDLGTVITEHQDISGKADKTELPTALSDLTDDLGTNPVHTHSQYLTSHQDISGKEDKAKPVITLANSGTLTLADNTAYLIANASGAITFTLPTITDLTKFHQIVIQLYMASAQTINLSTTYYFTGEAPDMSEAGYYTIIYEYDNTKSSWAVGALKKASV